MQRIKVFGGRITWHQWRSVARLAKRYSSAFSIHLTTRQDIELHNILPEDLDDLHRELAKVGLTTYGTGGDSIRNITVCPAGDSCCGNDELMSLAMLVSRYLDELPATRHLPRKFKISFSGCDNACARPWISDLGFIDNHDRTFNVIAAGSLGAKPATGIKVHDHLKAEEVIPLAIAAVEFFDKYGDRENRRKARFRHIRERQGKDVFERQLAEWFDRVKNRRAWPVIYPAKGTEQFKLRHRLNLPRGNIMQRAAIQLADAAEPTGAVLRLNLEHGLELYGPQPFELPESLALFSTYPKVVACPGCSTCPNALTDTWQIADEIANELAGKNCNEKFIAISGCPNGCAHSYIADIGLVGVRRNEYGRSVEAYRLLIGGGNGKNDKLAVEIKTVPAKHVMTHLKSMIKTDSAI